jgi:hypothetical protein
MKKNITKIILILIISLGCSFLYVKFWAGPRFIREQFNSAVSSFWDGRITFEHVQFNFFDDLRFKGVTFLDNNGRKWAYVQTLNATLENWPGSNFYLRDINIDELTLQLHLDTDAETFPLKPAFSASDNKETNSVLQSVNINSGSVNVIRHNGVKINLGDMLLHAKRREDQFEFSSEIYKTDKLNGVTLIGVLSRNVFSLENISGSFCGGKIDGTLEIQNLNPDRPNITGVLHVKDVGLPKLMEKFNRPGKINTGKATFDYSFIAHELKLDAFSGHGFLAINDADLLPVPLVTQISKAIGLTDKEIRTTSDATAVFKSKGFELEIEQAHFANRHEAIVIEPGGIIDLKNKTVDMHVYAVPLKQINSITRRIPVIRLFVSLKNKLTRLRIKGQLSDPTEKLIKKEIIKDITDGVGYFFIDIVNSGGELLDNNEENGK